MPSYSAYTLTISSELQLPGLAGGHGEEDLLIRRGVVEKEPPDDLERFGYYGVSGTEAHYAWRGVGRFRIADGREIVVDVLPDADERDIASLILGPFIAIAMHQRGRLILHASAVEMDGRVIGFMGESGKGKSTTAAAFLRRGYRLVSDDLLVIELPEGSTVPLVHPGGAQIKLWPEVVAAFGRDPETLPRVVGPKEKRSLSVDESVAGGTLPLGALYILDDGPAHAIAPLSPAEALVELIRHSYCALLLDRMGERKAHFIHCTRLAGLAPVRRLYRAMALQGLEEMVELVEKDEV